MSNALCHPSQQLGHIRTVLLGEQKMSRKRLAVRAFGLMKWSQYRRSRFVNGSPLDCGLSLRWMIFRRSNQGFYTRYRGINTASLLEGMDTLAVLD
jgi:hypothetical protein